MATPGTEIEDDVYEVNLNNLKVREIEEIEEILGYGFDVAFMGERPKGRALKAVAFVFRKRTDPDFTLEQAGDLVIKVKGPDESEPDPTPAPGS